MGRARSWIFGTLLVGLIVAIVALVVRRLPAADQANDRAARLRPAPVEVAKVEHGPIENRRTFSGALEAAARVTVAPKVAGRIVSLPVDLADTVRRGQIVATLDNDEYAQSVMQAEAELAVARANVAEAASALTIAARELDRVRTLHDRGVASDSQFDTITAEHLSKSAAVEVAKAQATRAEAALQAARIRLGYTSIEATWSGNDDERVVGEQFAEEGDTVAANTPLLSIVQLDPIQAVIFVTERDYASLSHGQPVTLWTDAYPGRPWSGWIDRVAPIFREGSRQARVEVGVPNEEGLLRPGMFVRVETVLGRLEAATIVPTESLTERDGQTVVFVVNPDGRSVRMVPVTTGIRQGARVEVTGEGIEGRVVTLGHQLLDDDSAIVIPALAQEPDLSNADGSRAGGRVNIPRASVRRPIFTSMITLIVIVLGVMALSQLRIDLLPAVEMPTLTVQTSYEGASPEVMERLVTQIAEEIIATVPGVEEMSSTSSEGGSRIRVTFMWGTDIDEAATDVRAKLEDELDELPDDVDRPQIRKFDVNSFPVVLLGIASRLDPIELTTLIDEQVRQRFARLSGVAQVDLWGGYNREVRVELDPERVRALGLPLNRVLQSIRDANLDLPTGEIESGLYEVTLRAPAEFTNLDQIRETVVAMREGAPVTLADIAQVKDTYERLTRVVRVNGELGLRMAIRKQADANTVEVSRRILAEIERVEPRLPSDRGLPGHQPGELHRALDPERRELRAVRWHARRPGADLLPPESPEHDRHRLVDSDLHHRHVRADLLQRLHAQSHDPRRARVGGGHDGRQLHRRAREHLSPTRRRARGYGGGVGRRRGRSRPGDRRQHAHHARDLSPAGLREGRQRDPVSGTRLRHRLFSVVFPGRVAQSRADACFEAAQVAGTTARRSPAVDRSARDRGGQRVRRAGQLVPRPPRLGAQASPGHDHERASRSPPV